MRANVITERDYLPDIWPIYVSVCYVWTGGDRERMTANHETYLLMASTQNDMEDWVKTIRRVIWAPFGGGEYEHNTLVGFSGNEICIDSLVFMWMTLEDYSGGAAGWISDCEPPSLLQHQTADCAFWVHLQNASYMCRDCLTKDWKTPCEQWEQYNLSETGLVSNWCKNHIYWSLRF